MARDSRFLRTPRRTTVGEVPRRDWLQRLDSFLFGSHECADPRVNTMQLETKFLRLRTPVELGSRFGDWQVTWLGGWGRHRLYYLVMVVKLEPGALHLRKNARGR
jgi:hypothetical protein